MLYIVQLTHSNFIDIPTEISEIFTYKVEMTPAQAKTLYRKWKKRIETYNEIAGDEAFDLSIESVDDMKEIPLDKLIAELEEEIGDEGEENEEA